MAVTVDEIVTVNPATEAELHRYPVMPEAEVGAVLDSVRASSPAWRGVPIRHRAELMHAAAAVLRRRVDELAGLITAEMGKAVAEARAEVEKCANTFDHFADHAEEYLADQDAPADGSRSFVAFEPLGTVLAIMPWNFPFWQVTRFAAPALMAGNTGVLKHASNTTGCALAIESVFRDAGFPDSVFRTLVVPGRRVAPVIEDARVAAITLTGSDETGAQAASVAARCLKKSVLELGGSDAFVVLEDADLEAAARVGAGRASRTAGRAASPPSASSWWRRSPAASRRPSSPRPGDFGWAIPPSPRSRWARWPATTSARIWSASSANRWTRGPACSPAGGVSSAGAGSSSPPCSLAALRGCPPSTRRPSDRWRR